MTLAQFPHRFLQRNRWISKALEMGIKGSHKASCAAIMYIPQSHQQAFGSRK
jgi:hypothetical protein